MSDVRGVNPSGTIPQANQPEDPLGKVNAVTPQPTGANEPAGPAGTLGQPTGIPLPPLPGKEQILTDVLAGRDPSQLLAAELLRETGGISATEKLLGLNLQPSIMGAFYAPPGNSEALRHMSAAMRRTAMRNLLMKQRQRMRRLEALLRREDDRNEDGERDGEGETAFAAENALLQRERAQIELGRVGQMLNLLEDLLAMQDYTISQMGTFAKG
jgi:hypothetical protein